jgi:hypothetical protein
VLKLQYREWGRCACESGDSHVQSKRAISDGCPKSARLIMLQLVLRFDAGPQASKDRILYHVATPHSERIQPQEIRHSGAVILIHMLNHMYGFLIPGIFRSMHTYVIS